MNKICTFFTIVCLIPLLSDSQFTEGQKLIGGNISFSTNSGNYDQNTFNNNNINHTSNTGIGINMSAAKFINSKTIWGIGLVYNYTHYTIDQQVPAQGNNYKYAYHSGGINIFSQRFMSLGNKFFFTVLAGATVRYNYNKQADLISKATSKTTGYSIDAGLNPGLTYKINDRFLFDAVLSNFIYTAYQHANGTSNYPLPQEAKTHSNSFYITTSLSNTSLGNVGLGFRWLLKRK